MKYLIGLFIFTLSSFGFSKTLVISDVDDTLKVVHTGNPLDTLGNAFDEHWAYPGMSDLYQQFFTNKDPLNPIEIVYLTNAPQKYLSTTHLNFLRNNNFPMGLYLPRPDDVSMDNFKFSAINQIVKSQKPDRMILIGDNIQRDPIIYGLIYDLYTPKGIKIKTFIHALPFGSTPIRNDQLSYTKADQIRINLLN